MSDLDGRLGDADRRPLVSEKSQDRWGAASGFVALLIGAAATMFERGAPATGASDATVAAFYATNRDALAAQSLLFLLGLASGLWFFGALYAYLSRAEGGTRRLSTLAFGAGVGYVALSAVAQGGQIALTRVAGGASSPELVAAMADLSGALFTVAAVPVAVMLVAVAVVSVRVGAFPVWLAATAIAGGVAQLALLIGIVADSGPFAPSGWFVFAPYPLYAVWLAATAIVMGARAGREPAAAVGTRGAGRTA